MDACIRSLGGRQADVVARWQLEDAGWTAGKIDHCVRRWAWRHLHPGVYLLTNAPPSRHQLWFAAALTTRDSALSHGSAGACYGFYRFDPTHGYPHPRGYPSTPRGPGTGDRYRLTVEGPGVTPDVSIVVPGLHDFDRNNPADVAYERQQDALLFSMLGPDKICRHH